MSRSMPPAVPRRRRGALRERPGCAIATAATPIATLEEFLDPSCVKALRAVDGEALYFSRARVPWPRDAAAGDRPAEFKRRIGHIGIYAYRVRSLLAVRGPGTPTPLEVTEKLEQLRALEHGMRIHVVTLDEAPPAGVDTPEDLERVRARLKRR